jgi:hypothetical protein
MIVGTFNRTLDFVNDLRSSRTATVRNSVALRTVSNGQACHQHRFLHSRKVAFSSLLMAHLIVRPGGRKVGSKPASMKGRTWPRVIPSQRPIASVP